MLVPERKNVWGGSRPPLKDKKTTDRRVYLLPNSRYAAGKVHGRNDQQRNAGVVSGRGPDLSKILYGRKRLPIPETDEAIGSDDVREHFLRREQAREDRVNVERFMRERQGRFRFLPNVKADRARVLRDQARKQEQDADAALQAAQRRANTSGGWKGEQDANLELARRDYANWQPRQPSATARRPSTSPTVKAPAAITALRKAMKPLDKVKMGAGNVTAVFSLVVVLAFLTIILRQETTHSGETITRWNLFGKAATGKAVLAPNA